MHILYVVFVNEFVCIIYLRKQHFVVSNFVMFAIYIGYSAEERRIERRRYSAEHQ